MYLQTIAVDNAGPITSLRVKMPFRDGLPLPLVLVGPNGSGKSTLISFIVNALVGFKQQAFQQAEIEHGRVYRVRGPMFIRGGNNWYHVKLEFEEGLTLDEWVLDRPRKAFQTEVSPLPADTGWQQVQEDESNHFLLTPRPHSFPIGALSKPIQKLFRENVVLFFPSDRFEVPDWLNEQSLTAELRFPDPVTLEGQTGRRIFSRALLRPTLEWFKAVVFDSRLDQQSGRDRRILDFVAHVLACILDADSGRVQFEYSHRNMGTIAVRFVRSGRWEVIPNLLGLSAGQAALFCVFCNVIRDLDLAGAQIDDISQLRGIVVLDEADLHLHVDLQYRILPELMTTFPKVQFIVTAHSPLFVMGVEKAFGEDGFRVLDMPSGDFVGTEAFSEFGHALSAFMRTRAFDQRVLDQIQRAAKPVVMVEGKFDVTHLQTAWEKLHPERLIPWDIVPCGGFSTNENRGGADMLRTMLRACCLHVQRPVLGLFDQDGEGVKQFYSLKSDGFEEATEKTHWKHPKQPVHALLLPVPVGRENFVSPRATSCFLSIEHYYSDALLKRFGVADDPVVADSAVFGITGDSRKKARLVDALPSLDKLEFKNFGLLFDRLAQLLGDQCDQTPATVPPAGQFVSHASSSVDPVPQMPSEFQVSPMTASASDAEPTAPMLGSDEARPDPPADNQSAPENNY